MMLTTFLMSCMLVCKVFGLMPMGAMKYTRGALQLEMSSDLLLPYPRPLLPDQIEVKRLLGKIDMLTEQGERGTSMRVFEATVDGKKAWLKEYLPISSKLGKRELATTRRAIGSYNRNIESSFGSDGREEEELDLMPLPVPTVLGSLRTDSRIEDPAFQKTWRRQFPGVRPPQAGNIWLIYEWDKSSFKSMRSFPSLPQAVDGMDYFKPKNRAKKRWRFLRKVFFRCLEACDFIHRSGCSHNSINSDSLWLSTTNEMEVNQLHVSLTDLGTATFLKEELGAQARVAIFEDFYALGFCFMELTLASFCDDYRGANQARKKFEKIYREKQRRQEQGQGQRRGLSSSFFAQADMPLRERELQSIFELGCDSDFKTFRTFFMDIPAYRIPCEVLDLQDNIGWRLFFQLMARGRLYDQGVQKRVSGRSFIRESARLFADLL